MFLNKLRRELGVDHIRLSHCPRDVYLLILSRFVRMLAFGSIAPILVLFLSSSLGFSDKKVGLFLSLTLVGDVVLSLVVSWVADRIGRRKVLAAGSAAMAVSGVCFPLSYFSLYLQAVFFASTQYIPLLLAATFGVISRESSAFHRFPTFRILLLSPRFSFPQFPSCQAGATPNEPVTLASSHAASGNEVGPFSAVENSILSQLIHPEDRIFIIMWYQVLGYVGLALGSIFGGQLVSATQDGGTSVHGAYRLIFLCYGIVAVIKVALTLAMTPFCEVDHPPFGLPLDEAVEPNTPLLGDEDSDCERQPLLSHPQLNRPLFDRTVSSTPHLQQPVPQISLPTVEAEEQPASLPLLRLLFVVILFSVDSFASSLSPAAYGSFFFHTAYSASLKAITTVLASSALGAVVTSLLAGVLVKRTGLVTSMVITHIPAQSITIGMGFAPSLPAVFTLYIARTMLSSVDSSIRSALLAAMVPVASRTRLLGIIDVCRTLASAPGPFVTGRLIADGLLRFTFVIGGAIKLGYDFALIVGFRSAKLHH
ncbi:hypothetical protein JCM11641_002521 [Rhodosporidiobolus odoratus]